VYGASKAAGELYTFAYWRTYGLPSMVVRPFNTYGSREPSEGYRAEVLPKFVFRALTGLQPVIFGTGQQTRDFAWVEDTANGIVMAAECDELVGDAVNIAYGQEVSIKKVCQLVLETLGAQELEPRYLEDGRPGDVERHCADISKAQKVLGYSPRVDIKSGVEKYVNWVQSQNVDIEDWLEQERVQNW
jgi:UDP-glucose 4-epimerase